MEANGWPWQDFQAFHAWFHSPTIRRTVAENGPCLSRFIRAAAPEIRAIAGGGLVIRVFGN
jgi:hypothetical protein